MKLSSVVEPRLASLDVTLTGMEDRLAGRDTQSHNLDQVSDPQQQCQYSVSLSGSPGEFPPAVSEGTSHSTGEGPSGGRQVDIDYEQLLLS